MRMEKVARELVRAVRGKRSQTAVNRKLGYGFNQVSRWETGRTTISWPAFVKLSAACKVDVAAAARDLFSTSARAEEIVAFFAADAKQTDIAKKLGVSRFTLRRWLASEAAPPLAAILSLVHRFSPNLLELVTRL